MSADSDYYKLPQSRQWLGIDSPYQIGGVSTEFSLIAGYLTNRVEYRFSGNVPLAVVQKIEDLQSQITQAEDAVQAFILYVAEILDLEETAAVSVTVQWLTDRGLWERYCKITGCDEWAIAEGLLHLGDTVSLTIEQFDELNRE